jgi:cytochrome P450
LTTTLPNSESELYYDPWDFGIDENPYPVWKRLRDEAPLYYNEKHDFYVVSRFDDVSRVLQDWKTSAPPRAP